MRVRAAGIALTAALAGSGCAVTMADVIASKAEGTAAVYAIPPERAYPLAVEVLRKAGVDALEEHRDEGYMVATATPDMNPVFIAAWIEPDPAGSLVTFRTRRKRFNLFELDFPEAGLHERMKERVDRDLRKSAGPAPLPGQEGAPREP